MHKGNVDIATRIQFNEFGNLTSVTIWTPLNDNFLESGNGMCYLDNVFIDLSVVVQHMAISSSKDWFVESKLYDNSSIDIFNVSVFAEARIITTGLHLKISGKESLLFMYISRRILRKMFSFISKGERKNLTTSYDKSIHTIRQKVKRQHKDGTKTFDYFYIWFCYYNTVDYPKCIYSSFSMRTLFSEIWTLCHLQRTW